MDRRVTLVDEADSDAAKLSAAVKLLELGTKLRDSVEFATRLERLETLE